MRFLSPKEFAAEFGRSQSWARKLCAEGTVRWTHEVGRTRRMWIPESEVGRYREQMMAQIVEGCADGR